MFRNTRNREVASPGRRLSAGAAAGTAAASTQRIGGGDGKTGAVSRLDKIHLDGTTPLDELVFDHECKRALFKNLVVFLWLIQSQAQRRAASATLHQGYTHRRFDLVLRHVLAQIADRRVCHLKHSFLHIFNRCQGNSVGWVSPMAHCARYHKGGSRTRQPRRLTLFFPCHDPTQWLCAERLQAQHGKKALSKQCLLSTIRIVLVAEERFCMLGPL